MWVPYPQQNRIMNKEYIEYIDDEGVVERVDLRRGIVKVRLLDGGDCGACPAARLCSVAKSDDKSLEVAVARPADFKTGDIVVLRGSERLHRKAIMYATVLPCLILIALMVLVFLLTGDQLAAALSGVGAMALFYLVLYLMRDRMAHEFSFTVEKKRRDASGDNRDGE